MEKEVNKAYELAERARKQGFDPEPKVDIPLAKNIFERVEGLIGAVKPELVGSGLAKGLEELDAKYGSGDWRIGLKIAEAVANRKYCEFEDDREAIEVATRVGLAYLTMGVVAAPLEGFIEFKIKNRNDGGKYASAYFAGPIRAAGGTAAAITLLLVDYLRRLFKIDKFDITDDEIARYKFECEDYHERIARLQYFPTGEELDYLLRRIPIEINGDPTSEREVLIHKDLPRVGTPRIRGGMCLVLCEGLAQKSPKIFKNISKWGKEFGLEEWGFLEEYIKLKTRIHAVDNKIEKMGDIKIRPSTVFIEETVAGRPIFAYPMTKGGFRLRYGRSRVAGLAACSINPATTRVLGNFIATGAQLRMERPGKACAVTPCSSIEGPVVKLYDESVIQINTEEDALKYKTLIKEILFVGDILVPYGEFVRNNHILIPSPYVEEWWVQEFVKAAGENFKQLKNLDDKQKVELSMKYGIPLHPSLLFFYPDITPDNLLYLITQLSKSKIIEVMDSYAIIMPHDKLAKKILEDIYIPHKLADEGIMIQEGNALGLLYATGYLPNHEWKLETAQKLEKEGKKTLEILNALSVIPIKNKSGIYIGARLGRPEKAKQRKLKGRPQTLFPVGHQGGRMRSLNEALEKGYVEADLPLFQCKKCRQSSLYPKCLACGGECILLKCCIKCGRETDKDVHCGMKTVSHRKQKYEIRNYVDKCLAKLGITLPPLVKGVRGTSNKLRIPEALEKGILRSIHDVYVNKDGTIRYDIIETPITHFKPKEVGTSIQQLKQLGYTHDIYGQLLENENQVLEIYPQDVILPDCKEWQDASAMEAVHKICSFVDDLLIKYYGVEPYYKIHSSSDMVGQLIIGLAPHTSAGIIGRIIGFSKTQCFFAHPYFHAACRRNCVHPETTLVVYDKGTGRIFSKPIGEITEELIRSGAKIRKDGEFLFIEAPKNWQTFSVDPETHDIVKRDIRIFLKGNAPSRWIKIKTVLGREFTMTPDHNFLYFKDDRFRTKTAEKVSVGDRIPLNFALNPPESDESKLDLIKEFMSTDIPEIKKEIIVSGAEALMKKVSTEHGVKTISRLVGITSRTLSRWYKNPTLNDLCTLISEKLLSFEDIPDNVKLRIYQTKLDRYMQITPELMRLLGYFTSEGHARENYSTHQVSFRICNKEVMNDLVDCIGALFKTKVYHQENGTKLTISNKLIYYLFRYIFRTGHSAHTKRVPSFIFTLKKNLVKNYLSAYFDGDGTVLNKPLRLRFYSVSRRLLEDVGMLLSRFGIIARYATAKPRLPGRTLLERYKELNKKPKYTILHHLVLGKREIIQFAKICSPKHKIKKDRIDSISKLDVPENSYTRFKEMIPLRTHCDFTEDIVKEVEIIHDHKPVYCLDIISKDELIHKNVLWGNQLFQIRCDGDEICFIMLMDALLNFSRQFLPDKRGGRTMDAPLVLTTRLNPEEVDDEVFNMDIVDMYPISFYEATQEWKSPYDVQIRQVKDTLGKPEQYRGFLYTHPTENINAGNKVSSYKSLTTVFDKVQMQMELAEKIRAVDKQDMARIIIEKHFLKDIKGNLRRFSKQEFRCISCNQKYRRIPLVGRCNKCSGKLVLTVAEGTVSKYLEPSLGLAEKYSLPSYLKQTLDILKRGVDSVFGKEPTKQVGLKSFIEQE